MKRFARIALTGVFAVLTSASLEAQQKGAGQQGQGQGGPAQGQQGRQGQPNQASGGQQVYQGGMGQTPWFSNPEVRQQFKLNDTQYDQLNKSYGESYGRYQQGMKDFGKDLTPEQRGQKMGELQQGFTKDFSTSANKVFTDPQQRQRYNELNLQYQGYNSFSNPTVQEKLNLTPEQRQQLGQQGQEWHKKMAGLGQMYQTDPQGATKQFNAMRKTYGQNVNTVLNPQQQQTWQNMTGQPYNFQPSAYFQTSAGAGATNNRTQPPANPK